MRSFKKNMVDIIMHVYNVSFTQKNTYRPISVHCIYSALLLPACFKFFFCVLSNAHKMMIYFSKHIVIRLQASTRCAELNNRRLRLVHWN